MFTAIIDDFRDNERWGSAHIYQSALRFFNYKLVELGRYLGIDAHLSTYAARHSWATLAYHCEIHPGIISEDRRSKQTNYSFRQAMIDGMQMPAKYYNWMTYSVSAPYLLRINSVLGYFYLEQVRSR